MSQLIGIITAQDEAIRNRSLDAFCSAAPLDELLAEAAALDAFRRASDNLYERVRALFFLYAIHRFHLVRRLEQAAPTAGIPFAGYSDLLARRFAEAIDAFLAHQARHGPSAAISSALGAAYQRLGFQTLADQVRRSVRGVRGNQWMFRTGHPADHPLRIRPELIGGPQGAPILCERTPVRMDLSHSAWSDIFFLGMDFPEGARVLNVSIDLGVHGRDAAPRPPVEAYLRVIDEPVLRLTSVDLGATSDVAELGEVFDFARDYLGLLKAALIAAGIIPPGLEGSGARLSDVLARLIGPGLGLELASSVNDIPKGSRLAVSTTLLAALIAVCMRATGQARSLTGALSEDERRLVAARAILGEWLGGSGGGWQDSGGVWPGMKRIEGVLAREGDPEFGVSRGRLLPQHSLLDSDASPVEQLQQSLVLVHGGMAQNVGPILEMVTEKYLLRSEAEWRARLGAMRIYDEIVATVQRSGPRPDVSLAGLPLAGVPLAGVPIAQTLGALTMRNFEGPIQTIIPWAGNLYTETLIGRARAAFGGDFWGFWMLGGMSGGGMGFIVAPQHLARAKAEIGDIMRRTKRELERALPFAMDPVVYDFAVNVRGTWADVAAGDDALMPAGYYALVVPRLLQLPPERLTAARRAELDRFGAACRAKPELGGMVQTLFDRLFPRPASTAPSDGRGDHALPRLLEDNGFDREQHERIRADLRAGRIGLAQNRLPANTLIEDVRDGDVLDAARNAVADAATLGGDAIRRGEVAVFSLAAGAGSRWTQGAGVVKALNPFCRLAGRHRSFLEVHLAKTRRVMREYGARIPHIVSTSYLTHEPIAAWARAHTAPPAIWLSPGRSIGLRLVPMARDLRFAFEEVPQQLLDEQAQKVRESLHAALIAWARAAGEGSDYTDNVPAQCIHPVGHWYELPNLLRNGVLARLLADQPQLKYLMLHNIDTVGADVRAEILGMHIRSGACLSFEMIERQLDDRGGGLARIDGQVRLVEGLAMPREEDEFKLRYYNSMTTWIDIDRLLGVFGLSRAALGDDARVTEAVAALAARMPTYITLKDVKKRWGHGQEDVFPVAQFEKLWSDMTALPEVSSAFIAVPRVRGQQLKDPAQLDGWLRDGSAAYVESLCDWV